MKKVSYYTLIIFFIVIMIPCLIVKGCSTKIEKSGKNDNSEIKNGEVISEGFKIKVYISKNNKVREMDFEEYLKGVVAAEMPVNFEMEALKSQAVAARTYVYNRVENYDQTEQDTHEGANICTNPAHCLAWISKNDAYKNWGILKSKSNWARVSKAVESTRGEIVVYKGKTAETFFHAMSGGRTENVEDVWEGVYLPYLKSVESKGEEKAKDYKKTILISEKLFIEKLNDEYKGLKLSEERCLDNIEILSYSESGKVKVLQVGNKMIKGVDFRRLFSLRSTNFKISSQSGNILITTKGYGHGVGMSQYGANAMAQDGYDYKSIIKHYYQGVDVRSFLKK